MNGRRLGSGITLEGLLNALDDARHRLRHRLILLAAYGPGYGRLVSDAEKVRMAPWTEDPAVPLDSAKPAPTTSPTSARRHRAA
jgi:hypothetical protein